MGYKSNPNRIAYRLVGSKDWHSAKYWGTEVQCYEDLRTQGFIEVDFIGDRTGVVMNSGILTKAGLAALKFKGNTR